MQQSVTLIAGDSLCSVRTDGMLGDSAETNDDISRFVTLTTDHLSIFACKLSQKIVLGVG